MSRRTKHKLSRRALIPPTFCSGTKNSTILPKTIEMKALIHKGPRSMTICWGTKSPSESWNRVLAERTPKPIASQAPAKTKIQQKLFRCIIAWVRCAIVAMLNNVVKRTAAPKDGQYGHTASGLLCQSRKQSVLYAICYVVARNDDDKT